MYRRDLAYLTLRLLAVYMWIQACLRLSHLLHFMIIPNIGRFEENQMVLSSFLVGLVPFVLLLIGGFLLWFQAPGWSSYLIVNGEDEHERAPKKETFFVEDLQSAAISVVGLIIVVHTIPSLFQAIPSYLRLNEVGPGLMDTQLKVEFYYNVVEKVLSLVLGFALFFGSRGLVGLLKKVREFGVNRSSRDNE